MLNNINYQCVNMTVAFAGKLVDRGTRLVQDALKTIVCMRYPELFIRMLKALFVKNDFGKNLKEWEDIL